MDPYEIEWTLEDRLKAIVADGDGLLQCAGGVAAVPVFLGITETTDEEGLPVLMPESHVALYCTDLIRESPINFNWTAQLVCTVATWQDEGDDPRTLHKARCLALRDKIWQDNLASQVDSSDIRVGGHLLGNVEHEVIGRHHVTRHHLALRFVSPVATP